MLKNPKPKPAKAKLPGHYSGRTQQLGLRVKTEFLKKLKQLALKNNCFIIEILEKALENYQPKKKLQRLYPHHTNFTCDSCGERYEEENAYSPSPNWEEPKSYLTYCFNCVVISKSSPINPTF